VLGFVLLFLKGGQKAWSRAQVEEKEGALEHRLVSVRYLEKYSPCAKNAKTWDEQMLHSGGFLAVVHTVG
jgi:hypothetical protein